MIGGFFWIHGVRITEKNSQLLSPERIKDIYETGNPYNHMIAQKKENASKNLNIVYAYGGRCWKGC